MEIILRVQKKEEKEMVPKEKEMVLSLGHSDPKKVC